MHRHDWILWRFLSPSFGMADLCRTSDLWYALVPRRVEPNDHRKHIAGAWAFLSIVAGAKSKALWVFRISFTKLLFPATTKYHCYVSILWLCHGNVHVTICVLQRRKLPAKYFLVRASEVRFRLWLCHKTRNREWKQMHRSSIERYLSCHSRLFFEATSQLLRLATPNRVTTSEACFWGNQPRWVPK